MKYAVEKVLEKIKIKIHVLPSVFFFFEKRPLYEIIWKNIVEPDSSQMTIWHMRITCWIPKATDIHLEYILLIVFPPQQRLHESTSVLLYVHCLSCFVLNS